MLSKLNPVFYLLSFTLFFWSVSAGISNYLGKPPVRKASHDIKHLEKEVTNNPKDEKANMDLALSLVKSGFENGDMKQIMQAVQVFRNILDLNPKNEEALLGLATLCLQSGVLDKAIDYYGKYLEINPGNLQAKTDLAMATFKVGQVKKGEALLAEVLEKDPKLFSAYAVGAIVYKDSDKEKSAYYLTEAKKTASSEEAFTNLKNTLNSKKHEHKTEEVKKENSKESSKESPKQKLVSYFVTHQIIGPKLVGYSWENDEILILDLKDFPVDKMPAFAKAKFVSNVKEQISGSKFKVFLMDADSKKELMMIQ